MTYELSQAARDVLAERERQISQEGWTPEHDDAHAVGELASAAACYAIPKDTLMQRAMIAHTTKMIVDWLWPWDVAWWKPGSRRRDLVKAGALILAEIERLDRAAAKST